eukprot:SAG31_NODE_4429_length_3240_cov_3.158867_2_plen_326_part_00
MLGWGGPDALEHPPPGPAELPPVFGDNDWDVGDVLFGAMGEFPTSTKFSTDCGSIGGDESLEQKSGGFFSSSSSSEGPFSESDEAIDEASIGGGSGGSWDWSFGSDSSHSDGMDGTLLDGHGSSRVGSPFQSTAEQAQWLPQHQPTASRRRQRGRSNTVVHGRSGSSKATTTTSHPRSASNDGDKVLVAFHAESIRGYGPLEADGTMVSFSNAPMAAAVPFRERDMSGLPGDRSSSCIFCGSGPDRPPLPSDEFEDARTRKRRRVKGAGRKEHKFGRWWCGYGYAGGPYCQRCSEIFRDHLIRQKSNSVRTPKARSQQLSCFHPV